MLINILSARTFKAHCMTYPFRVFAKQIRKLGITIKIHYTPGEALRKCDMLCVISEYSKKAVWKLHRKPRSRIDLLQDFKEQGKKIIWFDATDATGTTFFEVLPYVDLYAKNQLLRDLNQYTKQCYSNRIYSEYYHKTEGITDSENGFRQPAQAEHLRKLAVSWNLGLGDYHTFKNFGRRLRIFLPWAKYNVAATPVDMKRHIHASYRAFTGFTKATVAFQRKETLRQLAEMAANKNYKIVYKGKIPYDKYKKELEQTLVVPSPFGSGEVCFRDFECFLAGAALLKPDMSHLKTWPDYYLPDETYIPHAWDFSDFQEKLVELLDSPERCREIAQNGQDIFMASVSDNGGEAFAQHFANLVQLAVHGTCG